VEGRFLRASRVVAERRSKKRRKKDLTAPNVRLELTTLRLNYSYN
jgi:hypothetical protein